MLFACSFGNLEDRLGIVVVQFGLSRTSNLRNKKAINKSKYACVILPVSLFATAIFVLELSWKVSNFSVLNFVISKLAKFF